MNSSQDELRIVLIGRTGNGKSSTGNSLLHSRSAFHSAQLARSITRNCEVKSNDCTDINGVPKKVTVVDTPGFFDTDTTITNQMVQQTIASQIFNMTSPGVHAFLIVLRIDRFTPEEKNTVDFIKTIFGQGAAQYCIVIFTNEDRLDEGQTIDDFVNSAPGLQELVRNCGNRKFTINNKLNGPALEKKTKQLLQMINQMVARNNGDYYTNAEYQRIEKQRKEEQAKREQAERDRKKAYEDALVAQAREEERKKAEKREQDARAEERKKAEKREQEARGEERKRAERREQEAREEERKRAERREQEIRDEERRKTEKREQEVQERRKATARSLRYDDDDDDDDDYRSLVSKTKGLRMGGPAMPGPSPFLNSEPPRLTGFGMGGGRGGHGGRFTGEYMVTRGSANGQAIYEGSRGGQFYINSNGNKTYRRN